MTTVEWQTTCTDLKQRGALLLKTEEWTDCKLLVGPEEVPFNVHKLILSMASPVFENMFFNENAQQDTYRFQDMKPEVFEALITYIYTENITINSFNSAYRLYVAANRFLIPQLARVCAEFMCCNVTMETACCMYQAGNMFQDQMMMSESLQMIKLHIVEILHHKSFEQAEIDTVAAIFDLPDLRVAEINLYQALERYVQAHATRKRGSSLNESGQDVQYRRIASKALKKIRFLTFSLEEFAKGPARSGFFSSEEALAFMVNIAGGSAAVPPGFSDSQKPRYQRPATPQPAAASASAVVVLRLPARPWGAAGAGGAAAGGRAWRLSALPYTCHGTSSGVTEACYLAVLLRCEDASAGWSSLVRVDFTLVASGADKNGRPHNSLTHKIEKVFSSTQNEWGVKEFICYQEAINPSNGYVADGRLTVRAHLTILKTSVGGTSRATNSGSTI